MATIAVELVLGRLATFIEQETQLLGGIPDGIHELREDLSSMKCFLKDAEARSESDQGVKVWVEQVRDVAYDAEDVIEKFMLSEAAADDGHGFVHSLRNCCGYITNLRSHHQLAMQLKSINGRVRAISERRKAFSFQSADMASGSNIAVNERWYDPRIASLYLDEADVVGIEHPRTLLITWLLEEEEKLTSIFVVGMGGLGKTTLVKKVYDSQPIKRRFDCHSWVTVSASFSCTEILRAALKGFLDEIEEPIREKIESLTDYQLVHALKEHLKEKRYVIVFDDVWSGDLWEAVKFAFTDRKRGSRVIFTTRLSSLPASIENTSHVYFLQPLPENEAWTLFCRKAFRGERKGVCPQELEEMSRSILKKCEGLPLAISVIGSLLSKKNKEGREWKKVHDSLAAELQSDSELGSLRRILLLGSNDLPYYLKQCYLYLSVFPEDYLIRRMMLIRLWVVERFVEEKQGLTLEEVAEDYLNELANRNMIQVVEMDSFKRVKTCRIHDIIRELIVRKSREESLVAIANETGIGKNEKIRRLSVHDFKMLQSNMRAPYLRSLLLFVPSANVPGADSHGFKLLRVLELENTRLSIFPPQLVELIHLRYIGLRRTMVRELPESIKKLENLEILNLKGTFVSSLPLGILQLKRLCQLQSYRYSFSLSSTVFFADTHGIKVPSGLGRLTNLQKLGSVEVDEGGNTVKELAKLTQMRRLGILQLREEHGMDLCYTLDRMRQLTSLYATSAYEKVVIDLDSLQSPPQYLQRLYLKFRLSTLPGWLTSLQHLTKLVLQRSNLKDDPLKALQDLPSLVVLDLREAYDGEELCCGAEGYKKLKELSFRQLTRVQRISLEKGAMPGLKKMLITACERLEMVPLGIENLNDVLELKLWDMPATFFQKIERHHGADFARVQHIPTITPVYESQGSWLMETLSWDYMH